MKYVVCVVICLLVVGCRDPYMDRLTIQNAEDNKQMREGLAEVSKSTNEILKSLGKREIVGVGGISSGVSSQPCPDVLDQIKGNDAMINQGKQANERITEKLKEVRDKAPHVWPGNTGRVPISPQSPPRSDMESWLLDKVRELDTRTRRLEIEKISLRIQELEAEEKRLDRELGYIYCKLAVNRLTEESVKDQMKQKKQAELNDVRSRLKMLRYDRIRLEGS